jgi:hypothetical protein
MLCGLACVERRKTAFSVHLAREQKGFYAPAAVPVFANQHRALESPAVLSNVTTFAAGNVRAALERPQPSDASKTEALEFFEFGQKGMPASFEGISMSYVAAAARTIRVPERPSMMARISSGEPITPTAPDVRATKSATAATFGSMLPLPNSPD